MSLLLVPAVDETQALQAPTDPVRLPTVPQSPFHNLVGLGLTIK